MTIYFISGNGATSVAKWRFWRVIESDDEPPVIGETPRTSFEISYQSEGYERQVYAEALNADGTILGRTEIFKVEPPHAAGQNIVIGWGIVPKEVDITAEKDEL